MQIADYKVDLEEIIFFVDLDGPSLIRSPGVPLLPALPHQDVDRVPCSQRVGERRREGGRGEREGERVSEGGERGREGERGERERERG